MTRKEEKTILAGKVSEYGVAAVAGSLDVNSAHVSNVVSTGERDVGPTLRRAMIAAGWLPKPPAYKYIKIRRDDGYAAAQQLIGRHNRGDLGIDWFDELIDGLMVELFDSAADAVIMFDYATECALKRHDVDGNYAAFAWLKKSIQRYGVPFNVVVLGEMLIDPEMKRAAAEWNERQMNEPVDPIDVDTLREIEFK